MPNDAELYTLITQKGCSAGSIERQASELLFNHFSCHPKEYYGDRDALLLLCAILKWERLDFMRFPETILTSGQINLYISFLQRRLAFEPVSKIIGKRDFWKSSFYVTRDTLDPRADSEVLIEAAVQEMSEFKSDPINILDLGTGTGCLLLSLLQEFPNARGIGVDISENALLVASRNAHSLQFDDRVRFLHQDWRKISPESIEKFDIIITNPPYIPTLDIDKLQKEVQIYDPLLALDGGEDGLCLYSSLARLCISVLKPKGKIFVEIGKGQEWDVKAIFENIGFHHYLYLKDIRQIIRGLVFNHP